MFTDQVFTCLRVRPARDAAARHDASRFSRELGSGAGSGRLVEDGTLLPATLLSILITATVWLTIDGLAGDVLTLGLHYPLFLLIALVAVHALPPRWRIRSSLLTIPFVLVELVLVFA